MKVFRKCRIIFGVRRKRRRFGCDRWLSRRKSGVAAAALQRKAPCLRASDEKFQFIPRRVYPLEDEMLKRKREPKAGLFSDLRFPVLVTHP